MHKKNPHGIQNPYALVYHFLSISAFLSASESHVGHLNEFPARNRELVTYITRMCSHQYGKPRQLVTNNTRMRSLALPISHLVINVCCIVQCGSNKMDDNIDTTFDKSNVPCSQGHFVAKKTKSATVDAYFRIVLGCTGLKDLCEQCPSEFRMHSCLHNELPASLQRRFPVSKKARTSSKKGFLTVS